jgi:hypothetical protein
MDLNERQKNNVIIQSRAQISEFGSLPEEGHICKQLPGYKGNTCPRSEGTGRPLERREVTNKPERREELRSQKN